MKNSELGETIIIRDKYQTTGHDAVVNALAYHQAVHGARRDGGIHWIARRFEQARASGDQALLARAVFLRDVHVRNAFTAVKGAGLDEHQITPAVRQAFLEAIGITGEDVTVIA